MKIAINKCYGGFVISIDLSISLDLKRRRFGRLENKDFDLDDGNHLAYRAHPKLIAAIEKIGCKKSSGYCSEIEIVEIPDDVAWEINECDGIERIDEIHRSWS